MERQKALFHVAWGCILTIFGIAVFFRIPQVMPQIERIESFSSVLGFIRFCLYLLGALLIGGGAKKINENYRQLKKN
jgi:hypothetical protein